MWLVMHNYIIEIQFELDFNRNGNEALYNLKSSLK